MKKRNIDHQQKLRRKLARDFHDELGSRLSVISMYSELARMQLNKGDGKIEEHLDKISQTANNVYETMKDLLWTLDPAQDTVDSFALKAAEIADEMLKPLQIDFALHQAYPDKDRLLTLDQKRHLLLIVKEGLNNAVKYAGCTRVELQIIGHERDLTLKLSDNGKGFDRELIGKGEGLKNMKSRAEELGGRFLLVTNSHGTTLEVNCRLTPRNW